MIHSILFYFSLICLTMVPFSLKSACRLEKDDRLDYLIDALTDLHEKGKLDGEVLIAKDNQVLLHLQSQDILAAHYPAAPRFMIASLSKQFFAAALLKTLYEATPETDEETKCRVVEKALQKPLATYLSSSAEVWNGRMPKWAKRITLHELLTHTSGLSNFTDIEEYLAFDPQFRGFRFFEVPHSSADILQTIAKNPFSFAPGSGFEYCNTGYMFIAEVIKELTRLPISVYLNQLLFEPNGLNATTNPEAGRWEELNLDSSSPQVPQLTFDPWENPNQLQVPKYSPNLATAQGSGSIVSTAEDLLAWNIALHQTKSILPEALYKLMTTPARENYAYGIGMENTRNGIVFRHPGYSGTHRSHLIYIPDTQIDRKSVV